MTRGLAVTEEATRCHHQLVLEVKAARPEGKGWRSPPSSPTLIQAVGEFGKGPRLVGWLLISVGRCSAKVHLSAFRILLPMPTANHNLSVYEVLATHSG